MSRESIIAEIREDMARMQKVLDLLDYKPKTVKLDSVVGRGKKRHVSASARKKIAAAQRARWAKWRTAQK